MIFLLIPILLIVLFWLGTFVYQHDFFLPTLSLKKFKKALIIFPHPDDEVLACGGLIEQVSQQGGTVTLAILTHGDKGEKSYLSDRRIGDIRVQEAKEVAQILKVTTLIHEDFGDGTLCEKKSELRTYIASLVHTLDPDLVVTYDLTGLYGHPDHVTVSEIVTDVVKKTKAALWYTSVSPRVLKMITLPEHMAKDPHFKSKRVYPTHKVFVGWSCLTKITAAYTYRSQIRSLITSFPFRPIPPWFFISETVYEYFHEAQANGSTE